MRFKLELEKLIEEGWEKKGDFADYEIYGNKDNRIIYNPIKREVVFKYDITFKQNSDNGGESNGRKI